jgi:hypothetical protein
MTSREGVLMQKVLTVAAAALLMTGVALTSTANAATAGPSIAGGVEHALIQPPPDGPALATPPVTPLPINEAAAVVLPQWHSDPVTYTRQLLTVFQAIGLRDGLTMTALGTQVVPHGKVVNCSYVYAGPIGDGVQAGRAVSICGPDNDIVLISPIYLSSEHASPDLGAFGWVLAEFAEAEIQAGTDDQYFGEGCVEGVVMRELSDLGLVTNGQVDTVYHDNYPYGQGGFGQGFMDRTCRATR